VKRRADAAWAAAVALGCAATTGWLLVAFALGSECDGEHCMDWALADAVAVGASLLALVAWAVTRGRRRGLLWAATLPLLVPLWHVLAV
jgi:hypothetical protein